MKNLFALLYVNQNKDPDRLCADALVKEFIKYGIKYKEFFGDERVEDFKYDVIFVVGGDGTILMRTDYANRNDIPVVGINAGKLGFLSEFEQGEIKEAVAAFYNGELVKDYRTTIEADFNGKTYLGLNDVVVQRNCADSRGMLISVSVNIDGTPYGVISGDGVIVCTPTGSTAYSLSAGGAILVPGINAFSVTPIAAHSFTQRPLIYSADSSCVVTYEGGSAAGLFVDGKMVSELNKGDSFTVKKAKNQTVFLRRKNYAFYAKLSQKLKDRAGIL